MYAARVSINVVRLILTLMYWNKTNCRVNQHMSHVAVVAHNVCILIFLGHGPYIVVHSL